MAKRFANFCFTLNNYTWDEELDLLCTDLPVLYMCFGHETGDKGTPHLQGYCELSHVMRMSAIKKLGIGFQRMHMEARRGTQNEAIKYCKKGSNFIEFGTRKVNKQGQRKDLDECRTAARDYGMKEVSCWANLQEIRVAEKYLQYNEPRRTWKPEVTWVYGVTGSGKSKMAHETLPDAYTKSDGSKWWDGYDGHEDVILDDFRGDWMKLSELLTLTDRYERRIEFKGGSRQFLAKRIFITSSKHPHDCYNTSDENMNQLLRRIDKIIELKIDTVPTDTSSDTLTPVTEVGGNTRDAPTYPGSARYYYRLHDERVRNELSLVC